MNRRQIRPVGASRAAERTGATGVAVCLASSYLGYYTHSGFLRGLARLGVEPEHLAGCSGGAIVAGLRASGITAEELPDLLASMPMPGTFFDWQAPVRGFGMLACLRGVSGMTRGHKLLEFLKRIVGDTRIEDLAGPNAAISVTDLGRCESALLTSGPLAEAILASCAIPLLINAVEIGGSYYCDGGIANSLPIEHLADEPGIHTVIVHHIVHPVEKRARENAASPSAATTCMLAAQIIYKRIYQLSLEKLNVAGKRVIYCETITSLPSVCLGKRARFELIEAGSQTAARHRGDWKSLAEGKPEATSTL